MASSGSEGSDCSKEYKALVVQMRDGERKFSSRLLDFYNFDIDQAENGRQAVDLFVDGAVYDFAIRHIKSIDSDVKIVGTSEIGGDRIPFLQAGADFFLIKPVTLSNLFFVLARLGFFR
ncbi:hypothetical protein LUZ60_015395 [Juncus effusus]|nr:hypothetical protein LUZ60_015395 [Juncus effusus]